MRAEPATPPALLELANALFANGNRLARTAMSFEAWLDEEGTLPELEAGCRFVGSAAEATRTIAEALRNRHAPGELPDLRSMQRDLARRLSAYSDHHKAQLLIRIGDRLVDNVDTLAHITQRNPQATARDDRQEAARLPV